MSIQLNIVTCSTYPDKFVRDYVVAPFVLLSIVIATLPSSLHSIQFVDRVVSCRVKQDTIQPILHKVGVTERASALSATGNGGRI